MSDKTGIIPPNNEKTELFANMRSLRREIQSLRKRLNGINDEKESLFIMNKGFSEIIRKKIIQAKAYRKSRDSLTNKVKELKAQRNVLNEKIKALISRLKALNEEKKPLLPNSKVKGYYGIKEEIKRIELKMETEAMPFEKEKELSKKLKHMKKSFQEATILNSVFDDIKKIKSELDLARKDSNEKHKDMQAMAFQSQELHENIRKISDEIDIIRIKEEDGYGKFVHFKKIFNEIDASLQDKLKELNDVMKKVRKYDLEENEKRDLSRFNKIKNMEIKIEEKIKTGKKLTTDDLLSFQEIIKNTDNQHRKP